MSRRSARANVWILVMYTYKHYQRRSNVAFLTKVERRNTDDVNTLGQHISYTIFTSYSRMMFNKINAWQWNFVRLWILENTRKKSY